MNKLPRALAILGLSILGAIYVVACDSDGALIGEACQTAGSETECVDGAICDSVDTTIVCLEICDDDTDCAANEACNGVSSSSIKACHPKTK